MKSPRVTFDTESLPVPTYLFFEGEEGTYYYNITWTMWRYNRLQEVYRSKYFTSFPPGSLPSFDAASKQCKKYIYLINHAQKHSSREEVIYRSVYERTLGKRQLNKMVQHDFASDSLCWWYLVFWLAMLIFFLYYWLFFIQLFLPWYILIMTNLVDWIRRNMQFIVIKQPR